MTPTQAVLLGNSLDALWPAMDPLGRTFRQAVVDALRRASSGDWRLDPASYADVRALAVSSAVYVEIMKDREGDPYSDRWGAAMRRTSEILAKGAGYRDETAPQLKEGMRGTAAFPIIEVIALVVGAAAFLVFMYFLITNASTVVDRELARRALERELVRAHAAAQEVIEKHLAAEAAAGKQIPWSQAELGYLESLEKIQAQIIHGIIPKEPTPSVWSTPWPYVGLGLGAIAILGVVYHKEIRRALAA